MDKDRYLQNYLKGKVRDQKALIGMLRSELQEERFQSLKMRLDLQVLAESPDSSAARRIRHRYNIKKAVLSHSFEPVN